MSWHSCKVISLFVESVEGSRWALQDPLLLRDLNWQLCVTGGGKETSPKRECGLLCRGYSSTLQFLTCSPPFRGKVEEYLKRLWFSHHRKWNVEPPRLRIDKENPWSPFLSTYIRPLTHRQLVKTVSKGPLWVLAGLSGSCRLLTAPLQIITTSLLRFYYPLDCLNLKRPTEL